VRIGWLSGANVVTTEANGTYALQPVETPTGGVQALKVRRGTGNNAWMWVEYRQPTGVYHSTLNSQIFTGGLIHYEDSTTGSYTHLLDFTPGTTSYSDSALAGTWVDPYSNVSLAVSGGGTPALTVGVNYGPLPCTRAQPTVTLTPPNPSVNSGASASYTVSVTNNDSAGCAASTLALSSTLPSGFGTVFTPAALLLNAGQTLTATMTKSVPAGFTPGTYGVDATAADANHSTTGTANVTVTAPPLPISVTLTATPATVAVRGTVTLTAVVRNSNGPIAGANVTFNITRPGGATSTGNAVTNSAGTATLNYRAQQRGSYSARASSTAGGASATSTTVAFTAN
jgi:hypothetical protein